MYLCPKLERKGMVCDMSAVEGNQAFMDQLQAELEANDSWTKKRDKLNTQLDECIDQTTLFAADGSGDPKKIWK